MLRVRDQRVRFVLVVVLLVVIGYAAYRVGVIVWTHRQYDAATQALERYDYPQAAQHLERLLAVQPTDAPGLLLAAQTARRQGKFDVAAPTQSRGQARCRARRSRWRSSSSRCSRAICPTSDA